MRKRDNRGSTMIMVMVVLAVVGVLATIALWIALQNFQMKVTDRKTTDSFYSAEGVLDQICAGLQDDISDSMNMAYYDVMQNYASMNEADRTSYFSSKYVYNLRDRLKYSGAVEAGLPADYTCSLEHLKGFLGTEQQSRAKLTAGGDPDQEYCVLNNSSNAVVIEDLKVEYTDADGFLSVIQTDIQLAIPSLNLTESANLPNPFSYSIIGNAGVEFGTGTGIRVKGNVYAGSQNALDASRTSKADYESLIIQNGATVNFSDMDYLIVDGDADIIGNPTSQATFSVSAGSQFWARNIDILSAWADLYGNTYVADDLTLAGKYPSVYFGRAASGADEAVSGNYVGYGTSNNDPEKSSAIVINGTDSVLDMSNIGSMVVAGYSYIGTGNLKDVEYDSGKTSDNGDVQMAGSISVKGDQIAYLVPPECVGVVGETGKPLYNKNPMSVAEYKEIISDSDKYTLVNTSVTVKRIGKPLSKYLGSVSGSDCYRMTVVPSKTGNADDGLVYLYLNLSPSEAKSYFEDYYGADGAKLEKYTNFYTNAINSFSSDASIFTAGLYATYEDDVLSYGQGSDSINGKVGDLPVQYECLTSALMPDNVSEEMKQKTVFENIINVEESSTGAGDGLRQFLAHCTGKQCIVSVHLEDSEKATVVLIDNAGGSAYHFLDTDAKNHYLIVATGDVVVEKDFSGTIIANGKVSVSGTPNMKIESTDKEYMKKLLRQPCESQDGTTTVELYKLFKEGSAYIANGINSADDVDSDTQIGIGDLITYNNWKKM